MDISVVRHYGIYTVAPPTSWSIVRFKKNIVSLSSANNNPFWLPPCANEAEAVPSDRPAGWPPTHFSSVVTMRKPKLLREKRR